MDCLGAGGFGIRCSDGSVNSYVVPGIQSYQAFSSGQGFTNISGYTGALAPLAGVAWFCLCASRTPALLVGTDLLARQRLNRTTCSSMSVAIRLCLHCHAPTCI